LEFDPQSPCIWTRNIQRIECPVRHGEGRFVMPTEQDLDNLDNNHLLTVRYVDPTTPAGEGIQDELLSFPMSPNGSMRNIAGICDATGLVFGLMPHPEAFYSMWLHPEHTSMDLGENWEGEGLQIFRNAVEYVRSQR
jgi:phosphoribosylformylglycinamidine (FGAM) synthase-like amidotransferase family enzyme